MTTAVSAAPITVRSLGRPFAFLWFNAVSFQLIATADRFTFVWLADDTLKTSSSVSGLIVFMLGLPMFLFVLPAGALADRGNRRLQLLASQAAGAVVTGGAAVLTATDRMTVPLAIVTALSFGLVLAFAFPVRSSLLPLIVGRHRLMTAIPIMTIGANMAMIVGPVLAGSAIDRWGITGAFSVQCLLFLVSGAFVLRLHVPETGQAEKRSLVAEIREGVAYIRHHVILRTLLILMSVGGGCMMGPGFLLIPQVAKREFGKSAEAASALFGMMGIGMMVMSLLIVRFGRHVTRRGVAFMSCMIVGSSTSMVMSVAPSYNVLLALMFVWGLTGGVWANMSQSLLQEHSQPAMLGRVMSLSGLMHTGVAPLAALLAGTIAGHLGPQHTLGVFGAVGLIVIVAVFVFGDELRRVN